MRWKPPTPAGPWGDDLRRARAQAASAFDRLTDADATGLRRILRVLAADTVSTGR